MSASYREALEWLYSLSARGVRLELDRMRGGCAHRGNPERGLKVVHVAGSNGKGSVTAMVERVLREAGFRTGMFTSPHLHRYGERVRIGGRPLGEGEIARRLSDLREDAPNMPPLTFFEHTALLAFEAFRDHGCDVVALEVGLGGRLDATNVVEAPLVSCVTSISLEHRRILGDTHEAIAKEKGGVLKTGRPAVIGVRHPGARRVLNGMARRRGCEPWLIGRDFDGERVDLRRARLRVGEDERVHRLGLAGAHQAENAAVARAAIERLREQGWAIPDEAIEAGLRKARWPGRLETVRKEGTRYLFDCAHNPDGCRALAAHLGELRPKGKVALLFGALADKDLGAMLAAFGGVVDRRVYAVPAMRRAPESGEAYAAHRPGTIARSVRDGLARAKRAAGPEGLVVVAGSIFLVNEARAAVLGRKMDPPIAM